MSEEWISYPCQIGDRPAFVLFDHGARFRLPRTDAAAPPPAAPAAPPAPSTLAQIEIAFRAPREDGLSSSAEAPALFAYEDDLEIVARRFAAVEVGRVTRDGRRRFFVYGDAPAAAWRSALAELAAKHGYAADLTHGADPGYRAYWNTLYPSADDWQVISDLRTLEAFEKHGDHPALERRIEHWAYFPDASTAERFRAEREAEGYATEPIARRDGEPPSYAVRFAHEGSLLLADLTTHTVTLAHAAAAAGGGYDGWEAPVCKPAE